MDREQTAALIRRATENPVKFRLDRPMTDEQKEHNLEMSFEPFDGTPLVLWRVLALQPMVDGQVMRTSNWRDSEEKARKFAEWIPTIGGKVLSITEYHQATGEIVTERQDT